MEFEVFWCEYSMGGYKNTQSPNDDFSYTKLGKEPHFQFCLFFLSFCTSVTLYSKYGYNVMLKLTQPIGCNEMIYNSFYPICNE